MNRINLIIIVILVMFMIAGISIYTYHFFDTHTLEDLDSPTKLAKHALPISGILLVVGIPLLVVWREYKRLARIEQILYTGELADAVVTDVHYTGTKTNNRRLMRIEVEVRPQHRAPFASKTYHYTPPHEIFSFSSGMQLKVRFDPQNFEMVAIEKQAAEQHMPGLGNVIANAINSAGVNLPANQLNFIQQALSRAQPDPMSFRVFRGI